ncbi:60S ribosomal export protein NMD3 [[Eubacterium] cellulosolvens]
MFCVECGKDEKLYDNLCKDCLLRKTKFFKLPKVVRVTVCQQCSAWEKDNHWEPAESDEEVLRQVLNDQITPLKDVKYMTFSTELKPQTTNVYLVKLEVTGIYEDLKVREAFDIEIRINYGTCGRCSRLSGSYFEAKIQVRSTNRPMTESERARAEEIVDLVLAQAQGTESNAFLTKYELIHGGEDFYIGSSTVARQIAKRLAKEFAGKLKESSTMVGRKDGRDTYRFTHTVRIPQVKSGDFIKLDNRIYIVRKLNQRRISCIDVETGEARSFSHETLALGRVLGGDELTFDAVVIMENDREVQILDPENFRTVDLVKPKNFIVSGETVRVLKADEDIFLIPQPPKK